MRRRWPVWIAPLLGLLPVFLADGAGAREPTDPAAASQALASLPPYGSQGGEVKDGRNHAGRGNAPTTTRDRIGARLVARREEIAYRISDSAACNADGTAKFMIARAAATDDVPAWSPNGRLLAFTADSGSRTVGDARRRRCG